MLMSVAQRSGEIGLRRALGASRRHVVAQFLFEGSAIGALGSLVGTVAGEAALIVLAMLNGWQPVLARSTLLVGAGAGVLVGIAASVYPALRAARIDPATTLRS